MSFENIKIGFVLANLPDGGTLEESIQNIIDSGCYTYLLSDGFDPHSDICSYSTARTDHKTVNEKTETAIDEIADLNRGSMYLADDADIREFERDVETEKGDTDIDIVTENGRYIEGKNYATRKTRKSNIKEKAKVYNAWANENDIDKDNIQFAFNHEPRESIRTMLRAEFGFDCKFIDNGQPTTCTVDND